ncbi:MAG: ECF-type sigma factor [Hespellia sp.]|nr:ECF-type sigma factor [Hespellia sp.]
MKAKRNKLHPLSEYQKQTAEKNHNLIYGFIHRFGYSVEEHYSILVFGYLKAVQIYDERADLQRKYDFTFIAWMYMRSEIGNFFRMEKSKRRYTENGVVSLDTECADMENFYNTVGGKSVESNIMDEITMEILLQDLSAIQRLIVELKVYGYSNKEVYLVLEIKPSTYYKELGRIRNRLESILEKY